MGAADIGDTRFRQPEGADLAFRNQVFDRAGHVFHRHVRIDPVLVEEVDMVRPQALEAVFDGAANEFRPAVHGATARDIKSELGGDHHFVADRLQRLADNLFVLVGTVNLSGIEKGDAALEGAPDELDPISNLEGVP